MNAFALSGLLIGISFTIVAGLVYYVNRASRVNRLWGIFSLAVSLWGFGGFLIGQTADPAVAMNWWRLAHIGVVLIPGLFYHFVTTWTGRARFRHLLVVYAATALFLLANASPWFISHMRKVFGLFYYDSPPGILYIPFVAFFFGMVIVSHLELWRALRTPKPPAQRKLLQWFLGATAIGFAGGGTCFLPVFGLDVYPYGNFTLLLFPILMAYAFLRHRVMDVTRAVARGLAFLTVYLVVVGLPFVVGQLYRPLWETALGPWWWAAPVIVMGILASASPVLFLSMTRRLEQRLWQTQRRYHRTLIAASGGMLRIKDLARLSRLITHMVNHSVGLTNTSLFLYDPKEQRYSLCATRYPSHLPLHLVVEQTDPLAEHLQGTRDLVLLDELEVAVFARRLDPSVKKLEIIRDWMAKLEAKLIVPSFSTDKLLAFLVLGARRSGEPYATEDIALFSGLANQAALAIENAMFFEELRNNEAHMVQSEKLASLGQLASGMAHEIHNPLTIISGESQLYLERFKGQDAKVDELLKSIVEECKRAADITRRILRFAKPAPPEVMAVDLKATMEESLTLAGYQVRLERVERQVDVPDSLPKVKGNQNQLQEVLLNLILNACQAMGEQGGTLILSARAHDSVVEVRVADTGPGIAPAVLRKIFDPFYTTKPTGTGLGLFVSQRIVKSHGGTIEVESAEGQGTCFTIRLPIW